MQTPGRMGERYLQPALVSELDLKSAKISLHTQQIVTIQCSKHFQCLRRRLDAGLQQITN